MYRAMHIFSFYISILLYILENQEKPNHPVYSLGCILCSILKGISFYTLKIHKRLILLLLMPIFMWCSCQFESSSSWFTPWWVQRASDTGWIYQFYRKDTRI